MNRCNSCARCKKAIASDYGPSLKSCKCGKLSSNTWKGIDPRLETNFSKFTTKEQCLQVLAFHHKLIQNLLSFYPSDLTKIPSAKKKLNCWCAEANLFLYVEEDIFQISWRSEKDILSELKSCMPLRYSFTEVIEERE
jgi:hypothetical protein